MPAITIVSKQPPGGRCALYLRYAETLRQHLGLDVDVRYADADAAIAPPALLLGEVQVAPSDGVIVAPKDIAAVLADRLSATRAAELQRLLEHTQEQWMEEWSHD